MLTNDRRLYVAHGQNGPICINGKKGNNAEDTNHY